MGYAFISYSSKNQSSADAMRELFKKNNIDTWMAPYDIPAGSKYAAVITRAIRDCSCFVLLLSNDSQASDAVDSEVELAALTFKKSIIIVELEKVILNDAFTFYIHNKHIIALHKIDEKSPEVKKVLDAVKAYTENKTEAETTLTDAPINSTIPNAELLQNEVMSDNLNETTSYINIDNPIHQPETTKNILEYDNIDCPQNNTNGIAFNTQRINSLRKFLPQQRKTGAITNSQIQALKQIESKSISGCKYDWEPIKKFSNRDCYNLENQQTVNKQLVIPDEYTEIVNNAFSCACSKKIYIPKGINWIDKDCLLDLGKKVKTIFIEKDSVWYHISNNGKAISSYGGNKEKLWVKNGVTLKYYSRKSAT